MVGRFKCKIRMGWTYRVAWRLVLDRAVAACARRGLLREEPLEEVSASLHERRHAVVDRRMDGYEDRADADHDPDEREQFGAVVRRGHVSVPDSGHRNDAKVDRVDDRPCLHVAIEQHAYGEVDGRA